jgi:hypothetical protein
MSLPAIPVALYQGLHKMTKNPLFNDLSSKKCLKTFLGQREYGIAMKGKNPAKTKDIEGGLAAMDDPDKAQANIKKLIEETIQSTIRDYHLNANAGKGNHHQPPNFSGSGQGVGNYPVHGGMAYGSPSGSGGANGSGGNNYGGPSGYGGPNGTSGTMNYVGPGGHSGPS